jgi:hypothetical protein
MSISVSLRFGSAALTGIAFLLTARPASANGRFPLSNQIVFSPNDPNLIVARTSYGILPSHDNGCSWAYLCEETLGLPPTVPVDPEIGLTATNALLAGVYSAVAGTEPHVTAGLDVSTDLGCNWSCIEGPLTHQAIADLVVRPDAPDVVLAITSMNLPADDAGAGAAERYQSQVFQSTDDGVHWSALGVPLDSAVLVQTIDVSKSDPHRIYVSGTRGFGAFRAASLFVSTNDGTSWEEHPLAAFDAMNEYSVYIGAVDPGDPNRIYLRSAAIPDGPGLSRLFVTSDGGQSFQIIREFSIPPTPNGVVTNLSEILGFAISPDGSKVYAGSKEEGLFVASKSDLKFHQTSTIAVQCLATRGHELWACSDAKSGFIVGESLDDGVTFTSKMRNVTSLTGTIACKANPGGPLACNASVNGSQCKASFDSFCQGYSLDGQCSSDSRDAGPDACARHVSASSSCGCSAVGAPVAAGLVAWGPLAAVVLRRRRKQGRSATSTSGIEGPAIG